MATGSQATTKKIISVVQGLKDGQQHTPRNRGRKSGTGGRIHDAIDSTMIRTLIRRHERSIGTLSTRGMTSQAEQAQSTSATTPSHSVAPPSHDTLRNLFVTAAIPMVGFGFMDNLVMIQAGQYIDNTIGVTFGLTTMTAAAAGQVVSDVSGVLMGGTLERWLGPWMPPVTLSTAQRQLPVTRNVAMAGAIVGVMIGCGLGGLVGLHTVVSTKEQSLNLQKLHEGIVALVPECTVYLYGTDDELPLVVGRGGETEEVARQCWDAQTILVHDQWVYLPQNENCVVVLPEGEQQAVVEIQAKCIGVLVDQALELD